MKFTEDQLIEMMDANGGILDLSGLPVTELPDNFILPGSLRLNRNSTLAELPDGLIVQGDLDTRNSALKEIGEQVRVGGDLYTGGSAVEKIGANLRVEGSFYPGQTPLKVLPEGLFVGENLYLTDSNVKRLSDNSTIMGELVLSTYSPRDGWQRTWPKLEKLPTKLTVGTLCLVESVRFAERVLPIEIPADITVLKKLEVEGYKGYGSERRRFVVLPEGLTINGDFLARDMLIPRGLVVKGNCRFGRCRNERFRIPPDLQVGGNLDLRRCGGQLEDIPGTIRVGGSLLLPYTVKTIGAGLTVGRALETEGYNSYNDSIEPFELQVGPDVKIGGDLRLGRTHKIACLPDDMEIGGSIVGEGIEAIPDTWESVNGDLVIGPTKLPSSLKYIGGDVRMLPWSSQDALPAGLTIGGDLSSTWRYTEVELPQDLTVMGNIKLNYPVDELPEGLQLGGELLIGVDYQGAPCLTIETVEDFLKIANLIANLPECLEVKDIFAKMRLTIGNRE